MHLYVYTFLNIRLKVYLISSGAVVNSLRAMNEKERLVRDR